MAEGLKDTTAAALRQLILEDGLEVAAERVGLNTTTLLRAAVGLPLHNATRQLIESKLNGQTQA